MSLDAIRAVFAGHSSSGSKLAILLVFANFCRDDKDSPYGFRAWPSVPTVASMCGIKCHRQTRRWIHELVEDGELVYVGPHPHSDYQGSIIYRIPWLCPVERGAGTRGDGTGTPGGNQLLAGEFVKSPMVPAPPNPSRDPVGKEESPEQSPEHPMPSEAADAKRIGREASEGSTTESPKQKSPLEVKAVETEGRMWATLEMSGIGRIRPEDRAGWWDEAQRAGATTVEAGGWVLAYMIRLALDSGKCGKPADIAKFSPQGRAALAAFLAKRNKNKGK